MATIRCWVRVSVSTLTLLLSWHVSAGLLFCEAFAMLPWVGFNITDWYMDAL